MVQIPDYSNEPLFDRDAVQANNVAIDAEIAESNAPTVKNAWNDLQAVPSYVERYAASSDVTE